MISITIRFDDPGSLSDHGLEKRILNLLSRHKASATVAVIPACETEKGRVTLDTATAAHLIAAQKAGLIEIALHGYNHAAHGKDIAFGQHSEFASLPMAEQRAMIENGKCILEGVFQVPILGFIPPWNTYDQYTLKALAEVGFSYISAGWEYGEHHPSIISLPRTCDISELQRSVVLAQNFVSCNPHIIAVMHHYDFKEADAATGKFTLDEFERLLIWLKNQPKVQFKTLATTAQEPNAEAWLSFHGNRARLPQFLRKYVPREMLMKASFLKVLLSPLA